MPSFGSSITSAQENAILSSFEQDDQLWMVLFMRFLRAKCEPSADIKNGLIELNPAWLAEAAVLKKEGFEEVNRLCSDKPLQWSIRVKRMLKDPDYAALFQMFLRSLTQLRTRKINISDASAANRQRQVNLILASLAGELLVQLNPYVETSSCVERNQTPGGKDLTDISRTYYQNKQADLLNQISTYLAMVFLIKSLTGQNDIHRCQDVLRRNLIKPLEVKIEGLKGTDKKEAWGKLDSYYKMLWSMDVQFS
ncbi:MAG: hypothetical protein LWX83_00155 [Anaerolineae bacterium]|nr:hypothetical protein [Anaerolineae bacterium]